MGRRWGEREGEERGGGEEGKGKGRGKGRGRGRGKEGAPTFLFKFTPLGHNSLLHAFDH